MTPHWPESAAARRLLGLVLGLPPVAVLVTAALLEPDARGFGTHQQLGLGTCTVLAMTGWPCPMCGMTTAFTHMAHLQPIAALEAQPFGTLLFVCTALLAILALTEVLLARGLFETVWRRLSAAEVPIAIATLAGLIFGWLYKAYDLGVI